MRRLLPLKTHTYPVRRHPERTLAPRSYLITCPDIIPRAHGGKNEHVASIHVRVKARAVQSAPEDVAVGGLFQASEKTMSARPSMQKTPLVGVTFKIVEVGGQRLINVRNDAREANEHPRQSGESTSRRFHSRGATALQ